MDAAIQDPACHSLPHLKAQVLVFVDEDGPIEHPQQLLGSLLTCRPCILHVIQRSTPKVQDAFLDKVYRTFPAPDASTIRHLETLGAICGSIDRPPPSIVISNGLQLDRTSTNAVDTGGLMEVWFGKHDRKRVVIKVFRNYPDGSMNKVKKLLWERTAIWGKLSHPNVVAFRGVNTSIFDQLALVYDRAQHANINRYLASHPDAHRPTLLFQVATGLEYLHGLGISHGNLKGTNVLIDEAGQALLADYGFAAINWGVLVPAIESTVGNRRWLAPEILRPSRHGQEVLESQAADVFAFAMLAVEIFTGRVPFEGQGNSTAVCRIHAGDRPGLPQNAAEVGLTIPMWHLIQSCWKADPAKRPTIDDVVRRWGGLLENNDEHGPTPLPMDTERPPARNAKWAGNFLKGLFCLR